MFNILVTGGAGYIGSVVAQKLIETGHAVVVIDNLCRGSKSSVPQQCVFYEMDINDYNGVSGVIRDHKIDIVMHFAAIAYVEESMSNPLKYYNNNVHGTNILLQAMLDNNVTKFIFSSTCSSYGIPDELPITENTPQVPINPYGESKYMTEMILMRLVNSHNLKCVVFRYFNASGAYKGFGEKHDPETHILPNLIKNTLGKAKEVTVNGTDFDTKDGTPVRDYIHVEDLADAHILGMAKIMSRVGGVFEDYNLGSGNPYSIFQLIHMVQKVTCKSVNSVDGPRRPGDPPLLYSCSEKAKVELGWTPKHDLESIVTSAYDFHRLN